LKNNNNNSSSAALFIDNRALVNFYFLFLKIKTTQKLQAKKEVLIKNNIRYSE